MSEISVESILQQIVQLPPAEQAKLQQLWAAQKAALQPAKAALDKRVLPIPLPDYRPRDAGWPNTHANTPSHG